MTKQKRFQTNPIEEQCKAFPLTGKLDRSFQCADALKANKPLSVTLRIKTDNFFSRCVPIFYIAINPNNSIIAENILRGNSQHFLFRHRHYGESSTHSGVFKSFRLLPYRDNIASICTRDACLLRNPFCIHRVVSTDVIFYESILSGEAA
jgi:hypothetical protein